MNFVTVHRFRSASFTSAIFLLVAQLDSPLLKQELNPSWDEEDTHVPHGSCLLTVMKHGGLLFPPWFFNSQAGKSLVPVMLSILFGRLFLGCFPRRATSEIWTSRQMSQSNMHQHAQQGFTKQNAAVTLKVLHHFQGWEGLGT